MVQLKLKTLYEMPGKTLCHFGHGINKIRMLFSHENQANQNFDSEVGTYGLY